MSQPIAIVGTACRFPGGASSPSKLWELLSQPFDVLTDLPPERLNLSRFYHENGEHHGSTDVQGRAYFLSEDIRLFDAAFFRINPKEAEGMDPQQRILLETVYEALEAAGYPLEAVSGTRTSVHVGVMNADYTDIQSRDPETMASHHATGTTRSILSNRISYFFNFKGPSVTVDTACSSSLVALHQAVQGLRSGDATVAVAAGANLILDPAMFIAESSLHMLSPDSQSRMWDKSANGYARGEGFAAVILKPLDRAIADGDPIEGVLREICVNSDGRSEKGITNPNSLAQTALIRETYRRAGLDITEDRCQYFECHGTGTLAGDPVEARAIRDAFFPISQEPRESPRTPMYVGSIKTVIGHLEGCAGLAAVLKALVAIKHRTIPPNLHFHELNPDLLPFCQNLEVVTEALPWPGPIKPTSPLRVSVNSFGFGGTNAHAIIEEYHPTEEDTRSRMPHNEQAVFIGPLVVSAQSEKSLVSSVATLVEHIRSHPDMDLEEVAWTLQSRRSVLEHKAFFSGSTRDRLLHFMDRFVAESGGSSAIVPQKRPNTEEPGILGVFTGQGAQWASMGRGLALRSSAFRQCIRQCEETLNALQDPPAWSLYEEMMAEESASRVAEAAISQPLCTAIQIGLLELLWKAKITLNAVVGHSSGEIAAAYAAGVINQPAAMQIAYYRGFHAKLAAGAQGQSGKMMAVGMSYGDALEFCSSSPFHGRIAVAASNSPSSVTLSGDKDAIEEAKSRLDDEKVFARALHTDTAYHSHHMAPCSMPYLASLVACNIEVSEPRSDCTWISSVYGEVYASEFPRLKNQYWVDNMQNPVMFSQAIETSIWNGGPFDLCLEIGPHPTLKGPAEQTFKAALGVAPAYAGVMRRGDDEVEALSGALGFLWSQLGPEHMSFDNYRAAFNLFTPASVPSLPSYSWDHQQPFWRESRISRRYRLGQDSFHELLGRRAPDDSDDSPRWRNILRNGEIAWLKQHVFQGQILFPGAGFVVMALEAARQLAGDRTVALFVLEDIVLSRAIVIPPGSMGVEVIFSCEMTEQSSSKDILAANFAISFCSEETSHLGLTRACHGRMRVHLGHPSCNVLPARSAQASSMVHVDTGRFYTSMAKVGLDYRGLFSGMRSATRALDIATISASWDQSHVCREYMIHPGVLDVAFQALYVAFSSPASGHIWAPYLPVHISKLSLSPAALRASPDTVDLDMDAFVETATSTLLAGDISVYQTGGQDALVQVEGIAMQAVSEPAPENDKVMFSSTVWTQDITSGPSELAREPDDDALVQALDRVSLYYWHKLIRELSEDDILRCNWYHRHMLNVANKAVEATRNQQHPITKSEWLLDSEEIITEIIERYRNRADMRLICAVGENLEDVLTKDKHVLEVMLQDDLLNRFYLEGYGFATINRALSGTVQQIVTKFPQAKILEIGAGTGGTTRSILDAIGQKYSTYTYTDISPGFFSKAAETFSDSSDKMEFKVLDIENDVAGQGFERGEYDIVIAANVLHATRCLQETMCNVRSLLKPGGYLVMMEITGLEVLRTQFIMGALPGWWYGAAEGRDTSPAISELAWHELLRDTNFSGVDHILHDMQDTPRHSFSLILSQATDGTIDMIREPLLGLQRVEIPPNLVVVGGKNLAGVRVVGEIQKILSPWKSCITILKDVDEFVQSPPPPQSCVLVLQELEKPLFDSNITETRLQALQTLFGTAKMILWTTSGRFSASPASNMVVGMGRSLATEIPDLVLQYLDLDSNHRTPAGDARNIVNAFLRLYFTTFSHHSTDSDRLWTVEPEIRMIGDGVWLSRVQPHRNLNDVYNAERRCITHQVAPHRDCVELISDGGGLELQLMPPGLPETQPLDTVRVQVEHTMLLVASATQSVYLVYGVMAESGQMILALSQHNASLLHISKHKLVTLDQDAAMVAPTLLFAIGIQFMSLVLQDWAPSYGSIMFHEIPQALAVAMASNSEKAMHGWIFTTCDDQLPVDLYTRLHPASTRRRLKQSLPANTTGMVSFSDRPDLNVVSLMSPNCEHLTVDGLAALLNSKNHIRHLQTAVKSAPASSGACDSGDLHIIRADDIGAASTKAMSLCTITNWTDARSLSVRMSGLCTANMFSSSYTYLLVGMTGEIGLSLSRFMVTNGARHIVLASRNPNVSPVWLDNMRQEAGVNVQVVQMDVASKGSVECALDKVRSSMPRIAGVCNGSMVLSDKLFLDMDVQSLETCLRPKVDGSRILDEALGKEEPLQFFILLSSLASIIGNGGQSNYHAANMFMSSFAAGRREKGLAASTLHIGLVTDIGYVARAGVMMEERLRKLFFMPLSESDLHHAFAQAVRAGEPDSGQEADIIIGLESFTKSETATVRPPWERNPQFSHFVHIDTTPKQHSMVDFGQVNTKQRLDAADTDAARLSIIEECFSRKLEMMMQLRPCSVNVNVPLIDLGCDSLLAIEIRGWFLKELQVDLPVLKVLSGDTISELCSEATKRYLASKLVSVDKPASSAEASSGDSSHGDEVDSSSSGEGQARDDSKCGSTRATSDTDISRPSSPPDTPASKPEPLADPAHDSDRVQFSAPLSKQCHASHAQSRLWFLSQYLSDRTTYNVTVAYEIRGRVNLEQLRLALIQVFNRHGSLRTRFFSDEHDTLMQGVLAGFAWEPQMIMSGTDDMARDEFERMKTTIWDLSNGCTFGATVISMDSTRTMLIFGYHHIVLDGVSWHIFLRDLDHAYQSKRLPFCLDYCDYSEEMLRSSRVGAFDEDIAFWRLQHNRLPDVMPLLPTACVAERQALHHYDSHITSYRLDVDACRKIKQASMRFRATSFHVHLAVIQTILARSLDRSDLCIGIADANRTDDRYSNTVGFFLNLLPARFDVQKDHSFGELVRKTSKTVFAALSHSSVPFDLILDALKVPRSPKHNPLFQVAVNYRMGDVMQRDLGDCSLLFSSAQDARNPYDFSFNITEQSDGTSLLEVMAQKQLYSRTASQSLLDTYVDLLDQVSSDSSILVKECSIVRQSAVSRALELGRGPRMQFDWPATLSLRFDDMAVQHADDPAVIDGGAGTNISYADLKIRVDLLATAILESGAPPGTRVAVLCRPSQAVIVSMLAVLQSRMVYVPLDPILPQARHSVMVQDCHAGLLLFHNDTAEDADTLFENSTFLYNAINVETMTTRTVASVHPPRVSDHVSGFLLYTSGSTGKPKEILLSQENFRNHIAIKTHELDIGRETVLQQSSLGFDMAIVQTLCALANGGTVVVAPAHIRGDPVELSKLILAHSVSFIIATPSEYLMMLHYGREFWEQCVYLRHICMGGEPVQQELLRELQALPQASTLQVTNCYGPTEITAAATFSSISLGSIEMDSTRGQSLVGKVLPNYSVYIMDQTGVALPTGMTGEICIGGGGVALGYSGEAEYHRTQFLPDPYASEHDRAQGWTLMYRTGDKGWLSDEGNLYLVGRIDGDNQVKLHGQRIELDEVATQLRRQAEGKFAEIIVSVRGDPAFMVAHVVFASGMSMKSMDLADLARNLHLPRYMIPAAIIPLNHLPMTVNGKVDRKAIERLPLPNVDEGKLGIEEEEEEEEARRPLTPLEASLRLIWHEVLPQGCPNDAHADFFMHGGNSILLAKLQARIKHSTHIHVPIVDLYSSSTLCSMATRIGAGKQEDLSQSPAIDWVSETATPAGLLALNNGHGIDRMRNEGGQGGLRVLLTGATSFVGKALLKTLLAHPRVTMVHCIAVPKEEEEEEKQKKLISLSSKIKIYTGSLLQPNLGLSQAEYTHLQENINIIIHAGAMGHCLNNYSSLRIPNLASTRFLATLAVSASASANSHRQIPFHYISSNRVTLLSGSTTSPPVSLAGQFPPTAAAAEGGFTASKWASERLLENFSHDIGLAVVIHRACAPIGKEAPSEDALNALLKFSKMMRAVPRWENFEGYFDFKDVRDIAEDIVFVVMRDGEGGGENGEEGEKETEKKQESSYPRRLPLPLLRFVHHSSGIRIPISDLPGHLQQQEEHLQKQEQEQQQQQQKNQNQNHILTSSPYEQVPVEEWIERALKAGIDPRIASYLDAVVRRREVVRFPFLGA